MNTKKEINKILKDMILVLSFVLISIPLWKNFEGKQQFANIAEYYEKYTPSTINLNIERNFKLNNIIPLSDSEGIKTDPALISIVSNSKNKYFFKLYLAFDKTSTIDYNFIKLKVNNNIVLLNELENKQDDDKIYFLLDDNNISSNSKIDYQINLWLDSKTGNDMQGKSIKTNFILE